MLTDSSADCETLPALLASYKANLLQCTSGLYSDSTAACHWWLHLDLPSVALLCADGDLDAHTNGHAAMSEEDSDPDVAALGEEDLRKELLKV